MPGLGVTGGVATGKTTVSTILADALKAEVFDADRAVHELLATNEMVQAAVRAEFGGGVFAADQIIDRAALRRIVFTDDEKRRSLEQILHPQVRALWLERIETRQASGTKGWLLIDIPLLFETNAEHYFDAILVVACSPTVQRHRLCEDRKLPAAVAEKMMTSQLDLTTKIHKATHVIWNDGWRVHAEAQARTLAAHLQERHHG